jgi:asparagine synthase (glutamine-hydrolysing)
MCGIAGVMHFDGAAVCPDLVAAMTRTIAHRGPDGDGYYIDNPVGLGHRRLAIIDLSPAGKQPMANEDGSIWVTYNGEIYNFQEIRQELARRGHFFRSATDSEVIVHAYEEWGVDCLARFNGMFAFALWDGRRRRLWLARDRLGIKPLFYACLPDRLLFGSEMKAILADPRVPRRMDYEALAYFLALNYMPAPYTLLASIRQLLPGHYLLVDESGQVNTVEYWRLAYREDGIGGRKKQSEAAYREAFNALLDDAVRLRLVSDVPFGAFLSGGVDSSGIAYWMSRHLPEPVKTFSIGFGQSTFDELAYARQVAGIIGADQHEQILSAEAAEILPKVVWHAEEPTADSSMVAVFYLAQMARQHVTMALSGDGADEILAGYETYQAYYLHRLYRLLPGWLRRKVIAPLIQSLPVSDGKVTLEFKLRRFVAAGDLTSEEAHATWRMIFDAKARQKILTPVAAYSGAGADVLDLYRSAFARANARHPLNRMLYIDTCLYLPNDMLVKVDRMTMAHGLEARLPYLDYRLVEFVASVPPQLKLKNFRHKKYLLKASLKGKLPQELLWRKKQGFNVPNARWIKQGLRPFVLDHLSTANIQAMGFLDGREVQALLQQHFTGRADHSHQIWCLLTLSFWWRQFRQGNALEGSPSLD